MDHQSVNRHRDLIYKLKSDNELSVTAKSMFIKLTEFYRCEYASGVNKLQIFLDKFPIPGLSKTAFYWLNAVYIDIQVSLD